MTEQKKLHFLMRGVKQELFGSLVRNPPKTVAEFAPEAAVIEEMLEINTRQYDPGGSSTHFGDFCAVGNTPRVTSYV